MFKRKFCEIRTERECKTIMVEILVPLSQTSPT